LSRGSVALLLGFWAGACAARGHIATPAEVDQLLQAQGLAASGRITVEGPRGKLSARVVFGVARPDSLRIEMPAGTGLRFLLVSRNGRLRADLPGDDAMFEGPGNRETVNGLFGVNVAPEELVAAILGDPPESMSAGWRFDRNLPAQITIHEPSGARLTLTLEEPILAAPANRAFEFGPPRSRSWTLQEMSSRLGLRR